VLWGVVNHGQGQVRSDEWWVVRGKRSVCNGWMVDEQRSENRRPAKDSEGASWLRSLPAYAEDCQSRGIDRPALVRKHTPDAIRQFKERVQVEPSATQ
jgi:hypothetical protein